MTDRRCTHAAAAMVCNRAAPRVAVSVTDVTESLNASANVVPVADVLPASSRYAPSGCRPPDATIWRMVRHRSCCPYQFAHNGMPSCHLCPPMRGLSIYPVRHVSRLPSRAPQHHDPHTRKPAPRLPQGRPTLMVATPRYAVRRAIGYSFESK
jgi:hypothetical protein